MTQPHDIDTKGFPYLESIPPSIYLRLQLPNNATEAKMAILQLEGEINDIDMQLKHNELDYADNSHDEAYIKWQLEALRAKRTKSYQLVCYKAWLLENVGEGDFKLPGVPTLSGFWEMHQDFVKAVKTREDRQRRRIDRLEGRVDFLLRSQYELLRTLALSSSDKLPSQLVEHLEAMSGVADAIEKRPDFGAKLPE